MTKNWQNLKYPNFHSGPQPMWHTAFFLLISLPLQFFSWKYKNGVDGNKVYSHAFVSWSNDIPHWNSSCLGIRNTSSSFFEVKYQVICRFFPPSPCMRTRTTTTVAYYKKLLNCRWFFIYLYIRKLGVKEETALPAFLSTTDSHELVSDPAYILVASCE